MSTSKRANLNAAFATRQITGACIALLLLCLVPEVPVVDEVLSEDSVASIYNSSTLISDAVESEDYMNADDSQVKSVDNAFAHPSTSGNLSEAPDMKKGSFTVITSDPEAGELNAQYPTCELSED
eukprot:IDg6346t1